MAAPIDGSRMTTTTPKSPLGTVPRPVRPFFRLPGVYRPQADTRLLSETIAAAGIPSGGRVLDLCTGAGAQAMAAARSGAASVLAIDISRRAVATTRLNAVVAGLPIRVRRGGLHTAARYGPFELVVANPPYVPAPLAPTRGSRGWDAGADGRAVLDPLCRAASELLAREGTLLLVQSAVAGVDTSLDQLADQGLTTSVVASARVPFGPVMSARAGYLEERGLIQPGQRMEEVVVIRADRR